MAPKHVAFAPACQKQLGSRLRSPLIIGEIASSLRSSQRPLSLSHGFFTIQPSPCKGREKGEEKKGTGYFFSKKEKVSTHGQNNRKSSLSPFSPSMSGSGLILGNAIKARGKKISSPNGKA